MKINGKVITFERGDTPKLNIGCGFVHKKGYVNLDIQSKCSPDIVCDIDKGLPFNDNFFEEIVMDHVLEHVKNVFFVLDEIKRVLKKDGVFKCRVPHFSCLSAHYYQHNRSFRCGDCKDMGFKVAKLQLVFEWKIGLFGKYLTFGFKLNDNRFNTLYERFMLLNHLIPSKEIYFELVKTDNKVK